MEQAQTISIYITESGQITSTMMVWHEDDITGNVGSDESYLIGDFNPELYYVSEGVAYTIPANNSNSAIFDYTTKTWVEPFTETELLDRRRAAAYLDRYTFCQRCYEKQILSRDDALALGTGQIPYATKLILNAMPDAISFEAELRWSTMTTVNRKDIIITEVFSQVGIPEIMLDHIFEVEGFVYS